MLSLILEREKRRKTNLIKFDKYLDTLNKYTIQPRDFIERVILEKLLKIIKVLKC